MIIVLLHQSPERSVYKIFCLLSLIFFYFFPVGMGARSVSVTSQLQLPDKSESPPLFLALHQVFFSQPSLIYALGLSAALTRTTETGARRFEFLRSRKRGDHSIFYFHC